ncbi:FecR protein [Pirellulimonas nuda]|uniref:FecR protein n=1 Tax=Pirellulimonas nuda TaxID=2528009 RepID=A0A518DHH2_9BACT|nr:FecR domain-containing protein [Pirellulimonas nuda]QDU90925.1 FecR protein [Pirellulimonas nuda]
MSHDPLNHDPDRLLLLADRFLSGEATPREVTDLEALLLSGPDARAEFIERVCVDEDIRFAMRARRANSRLIGDLLSLPTASVERAEPVAWERAAARASRPWVWLAALAAALTLAVWIPQWRAPSERVAAQIVREHPPKASPTASEDRADEPRTVDTIAVLYNHDHAVWSDGPQDLARGTTFGAGAKMNLASGLADVAFRSGAQLVIEGPAELELVSDMEVLLIAGRLSAKVPPDAIGFAVRTEEARILDLGTEFGVVARHGGGCDVVVFDGEVIVAPRGRPGQNQRLLAGAALRASATELVRADNELNPDSFTRRVATQGASQGARLVANFRRDFRSTQLDQRTPAPSWRFLWNARGPLGNPDHYQDLRWNGEWGYTTAGSGPFPAPPPAKSLCLRETGGHPGPDAKTAEVDRYDHGPVAAFTVPQSGDYAIVDSWLSRLDDRRFDEIIRDNEFGIDVVVHVDHHDPAFSGTGYDTNNLAFDVDLPGLESGDTIYVAIGPNSSSRYDSFAWNFSIVQLTPAE